MCRKKVLKIVVIFLLSKIPYRIAKELSRVSLKLIGVGRIATIDEEVRTILELSNDLGEFDFLDIGANIGNYSLEINSTLPNLGIYAFEPSKSTFSTLVKNLESKGIHCFNTGFGDKTQVTRLYYDSPESGLASLSKRNLGHFNIDFDLSEEVQILTIDSWLTTNKLRNNLVVKMDIEGHEFFALRGAQSALKTRIKVLQFEFGGANVSAGVFFIDIWSILNESHTIYRLTFSGLETISAYTEDLENFVNTTYYAKSKV